MHSILPCLHDHWKIKSNYMNRGTRAIKINEKCKNAMCNHYYFGAWMATGNLLTSNHIVSKLHISAVKWNPTLRPQKPQGTAVGTEMMTTAFSVSPGSEKLPFLLFRLNGLASKLICHWYGESASEKTEWKGAKLPAEFSFLFKDLQFKILIMPGSNKTSKTSKKL